MLVDSGQARQLVSTAFPAAHWTSPADLQIPGEVPIAGRIGQLDGKHTIFLRCAVAHAPPVWVWVARTNHHLVGVGAPQISIGDPSFDSAFRVHAVPSDLVRSAMSDHLRQLLAAHAGKATTLTVRDGEVTVVISPREAGPSDLAGLATVASQLAHQLSVGYQQKLQAATHQGGPSAAHALDAQMKQTLLDVEAKQKKGSFVLLGCVVLFIVALLVGVGFKFVDAIGAVSACTSPTALASL